MAKSTWMLLTPPSQGAIAIVQLVGDVTSTMYQLTNREVWEDGRLYLVNIPDIDEAVSVKINDDLAYIMPHGGLQILRKLAGRFSELEIEQCDEPQFPEAKDEFESQMLKTLAIAESPLAVALLLKQPELLRANKPTEEDIARSKRLHHLIIPPIVVLQGAPNTGKSTLMNALTKQDTSIVHDLPGATRDAVGTRINCGGLVIDLYDLPGFRESDDPIEREAIRLAQQLVNNATLTICIADAEHDWLISERDSMRVATKSDLKSRDDADICVSAHSGKHMQELCVAIRDAIVPPDILSHDGPWLFYNPIEE